MTTISNDEPLAAWRDRLAELLREAPVGVTGAFSVIAEDGIRATVVCPEPSPRETSWKALKDRIAREIAGLREQVSALNVGDVVRVTFYDGTTLTGPLRRPGRAVLDPGMHEDVLILDVLPYPVIRTYDGLPASNVRAVERWDEDARFDLLMDWAQDYLAKAAAAQTCPKSEQGPALLAAEEAKDAFIAEFIRSKAVTA